MLFVFMLFSTLLKMYIFFTFLHAARIGSSTRQNSNKIWGTEDKYYSKHCNLHKDHVWVDVSICQ